MADVVSPKRKWLGGRNHFFVHTGVKNISVTTDKILFGRVSGEELNDKFEIIHCPTMLAEFPSYDVIKTIYDEAPKLLSEMCAKPFVLPLFDIAVKFAEQPTEPRAEEPEAARRALQRIVAELPFRRGALGFFSPR